MTTITTASGSTIWIGSTGNFSTSTATSPATPIFSTPQLTARKPERARRLLKKNNMIGEYARAGVYLLYWNKTIVYVGQSISPYRRIGQHIGKKKFDEFRILHCAKHRLNHWERKLINSFNPKYNYR